MYMAYVNDEGNHYPEIYVKSITFISENTPNIIRTFHEKVDDETDIIIRLNLVKRTVTWMKNWSLSIKNPEKYPKVTETYSDVVVEEFTVSWENHGEYDKGFSWRSLTKDKSIVDELVIPMHGKTEYELEDNEHASGKIVNSELEDYLGVSINDDTDIPQSTIGDALSQINDLISGMKKTVKKMKPVKKCVEEYNKQKDSRIWALDPTEISYFSYSSLLRLERRLYDIYQRLHSYHCGIDSLICNKLVNEIIAARREIYDCAIRFEKKYLKDGE